MRSIRTCVVIRVAPRAFVVERHTITAEGIYCDGRTWPMKLAEARRMVPVTMRNAGRRESDHPSIVEVWF